MEQVCSILALLENFDWRYTSVSGLANTILLFIEMIGTRGASSRIDAKIEFRCTMERLTRDLRLYRNSPHDLIKMAHPISNFTVVWSSIHFSVDDDVSV
jgi:RAP1 GTPase activating protein 1